MILVFRYLHTEENESMINADVDVELVMDDDTQVEADLVSRAKYSGTC